VNRNLQQTCMSAGGQRRVLVGAGAAAALVGWCAWRRRVEGSPGPDLLLDGRPGAAAVTGASSGIGEAYARLLASRGMDLVLIGRREDRLERVAAELRAAHRVSVDVLAADLSRREDVERVGGRLAGMGRLVLLVNNAGFQAPGRFEDSDLDHQLRMIGVHVSAAVSLTRVSLPGMVARGKGFIVNVASIAAFIPLVENVNYSATKSFLVTLSEGLAAELHGSGVRVQALCPGYVDTDFYDVPGSRGLDRSLAPRALRMGAGQVVEESLRALGGPRVVVAPGASYRVIALLAREPFLMPFFRFAARLRRP
jgi:short-subunit dehydrogenase